MTIPKERKRRRAHPLRNFVYCGCGKVFSPSQAAAKRTFQQISLERPGEAERVTYYECRYGGWHWTRRVDG